MRLPFLFVPLGAAACGPAPPAKPSTPPPMANTCASRLPPATDPPTAAPVPLTPAARSLLVVNVDVPLANIAQGIEPKVPKRVAQEKDRDIGVAGRLEYTVDRGPFALHVEGSTLVVEAPLTANVQACAKGRCYAGCQPQLTASAKVPLELGADYRLHSSGVTFTIVRGCELRALGGLLTIDVTPMLQGALAAQGATVNQEIDRQLPSFRGEASILWTEVQKPVALPLGACLLLDAEEIVQGPSSGDKVLAKLRFGLGAHPELRVECKDVPAASARALPPLRHDAALAEQGDVHLAIALSPDAPARALAGSPPFDLGTGRAQISSATGDAKRLALTLTGEVCGDAIVNASGAAWTKRQALHLTGAAPAPFAAGVEQAEIPLPIAIDALPDLVPQLAQGFKDDRVAVAANVATARPESAGLRDGTTPLAVAYLKGAVTLTVR